MKNIFKFALKLKTLNEPVVIILIIGLYFAALLMVSHLTSRGATNSTYFTGNRNMAWPLVALAMITAPISGVTFISAPGMVVTKGYGYLQMCLGFIVGYFLIGWVLVPLFYKHNIISIYSYLENRFGKTAYKTGAWLFLISEILGVGVRFMVVCIVLQQLVFGPLNLTFSLNVMVTIFLIWLYTAKGGVKAVIWSDMLKSLCLVTSVLICFFFITESLGISFSELPNKLMEHPTSKIFFLEDPMESSYFWKQFLTGVFIVVAMTGLDQDMMQRILACKDYKGSRKNLAVSGIMQFIVISLFLMLGTLMAIYMEQKDMEMPEKTDSIFALVAMHSEMPMIVGVMFILGIVSASYSSVGSALTSLTTSYTVDILEATKKYDDKSLKRKRKYVHTVMALVMAIVILLCYYLNDQDAITALFTLASYTYGPILGLFVFGMFTKRYPKTQWVALICVMAPLLSGFIGWFAKTYFDYNTGYELFLMNVLLTIIGLSVLPSERIAYEPTSMSENLTV